MLVHGNSVHDGHNSINEAPVRHNEFVTLADIRRIQKDIEAEVIRLDPDDGRSTAKWAEDLRSDGCLLAYKSKSCSVPPDSCLRKNLFCLVMQTHWQRDIFAVHG